MLPKLKEIPYKHETHTIDFRGLNRLSNRMDGELVNMINLTSLKSPMLCVRQPREVFKDIADVSYVGSHGEHFFYIKGTEFFFNDTKKGDVAAGEKQIEVMNDYVVIFPDKKMYDITNDKWIAMQKEVTCTTISYSGKNITVGGVDLKSEFEVGDGLKIVGGEHDGKTFIIKSFPYGNVMEVGENLFSESWDGTNVGLKREVPDLEFIVEHENRLWGCKGNEVFASRQGSCTNFNVFEGVSSDSYAAEVGTPGPFTALVNYNNNLIFFKENVIHKVYGNKPSNYQIITHQTKGVMKGSHNSLVIANGILFYKTTTDIVAYNGAGAEIISSKLGLVKYDYAIAGSDDKKVYYCLHNQTGYELLVFDTLKNVWHREDTTEVKSFAFYKGDLILATPTQIVKATGETKENVPFLAEFGPFREQLKDKKSYSKINLECYLSAGAEVNISIRHDEESYTGIATLTGDKRDYRLPIQPKRCNSFMIKLEGKGPCEVAALTRTFKVRSDI